MSKIKQFIKSPLFNVILLLVLSFLVYRFVFSANLDQIKSALSKGNPALLVLCAGLAILQVVCAGLALSTYAKLFNKKFGVIAGTEACFIGAMAGGIMPFGSGTQVFQFYVFRKYDTKPADSVSILFIDFIVYQATMILTILTLLILRFTRFTGVSQWFWLVILGFFVNSFILVVLFLVAQSSKFHHFISTKAIHFLAKIKIVKDKDQAIKSLNSQIEQFHQAQDILKHNKNALMKGVFANLMRLLLVHSLPFFIALALGVNVSVAQLLDIIALSAFTAQLNAFFPTPGATGGTEVVFKTMFEPLFKTVTMGVLVVWRFVSYYLIVLIGALLFVKVRHFKAQVKEA